MDTKKEKAKKIGARLKAARIAAGHATATDAAEMLGESKHLYIQYENGTANLPVEKAEIFAKRFRSTPEYILFDRKAGPTYGRIVGKVGANPDGSVIFNTGQDRWDEAELPPGADPETVILEVEGDSNYGIADDGSLIYFSKRLDQPNPSMMKQLVVCELDTGQVVIKRLMKGSTKDTFNLMSINAPPMEDQRLVWVAHVTWIAPPYQAQKIIRRGIRDIDRASGLSLVSA